ncbi:MAG: hypothetical protein HUJ68_09930 [Clostridia bacterium]|nr:hypothetical protein [Clostridia bacterium]
MTPDEYLKLVEDSGIKIYETTRFWFNYLSSNKDVSAIYGYYHSGASTALLLTMAYKIVSEERDLTIAFNNIPNITNVYRFLPKGYSLSQRNELTCPSGKVYKVKITTSDYKGYMYDYLFSEAPIKNKLSLAKENFFNFSNQSIDSIGNIPFLGACEWEITPKYFSEDTFNFNIFDKVVTEDLDDGNKIINCPVKDLRTNINLLEYAKEEGPGFCTRFIGRPHKFF